MSDKYEYPQINGVGEVTEDAASLDLILAKHGPRKVSYDLYLYVERIHFSVYKAAIGGAGICELKTIDGGDVVYTINVDDIKEVDIDWGDEGVKVSDTKDCGLQAVVSGGDTQASVSVGIAAHYNREKEDI